VCVRRISLTFPQKFELISGRRRLRAAALAGFTEIAAIVLDITDEEAAAITVVENIQRYSPDFFEEAAAIDDLRARFGYSQEETARLLGLSQSCVANKLRLLRLSNDTLATVRDAGLSERHARVLLRLPDATLRSEVLSVMITRDLTVAEAEALTDKILESIESPPTAAIKRGEAPPDGGTAGLAENAQELIGIFEDESATAHGQKTAYAGLDPQFYINSIEQGAQKMRQAGYAVDVVREEGTGGEITVNVRIGKAG
jgi:ParB/RepB/Spo0J family partition protein